jgi:hypothetical protein
MSCGINERPKGPKPKVVPNAQGGSSNAAYLAMVDFAMGGQRGAPLILPSGIDIVRLNQVCANCRNCGASSFRQGKCEYCGTNQ